MGDNISKWVLNTNTAQETNLSMDNKALIYLLWPSDDNRWVSAKKT